VKGRHAVRELLAEPDFRRLLGLRLSGQFADGLFQAALVSAVFFDPNRATTATEAAVGFATLLLPFSVVGPFAGVFLDRWRRQRVLLLSNLGRAALIVLLAPLLAGTADLVVGVRVAERRERGAMTIQQRAGNVVASQLIGRLYGTPVSDLGPFRAIRRDHLLALGMTDMTYGWSTEMLVKSLRFGYRYREVPVGYRRRGAGYSKVGGNLGAGLKAGGAIFATALRHAARPVPSTTQRLEDGG